jgi:NitT/TauT family transport system substrate-binding protein
MTALTRAAQTLLFTAALMLATASHAAETIIAGGVSSASANLWPVYVGIKKGFFADVDIRIDLIFSQSNTATIQQLVVNAINVSIGSGLVDPIRAIEKGAPLAIARIEALRPRYALVSKPGIREMKALTGKIVSVGGAKDITRIFLERMLIRAGVDPKGVDLIFAGATSARLAAMQSGAADAAMLTTPYNFHAIAAGFTNLGLAADYVDMPFSGVATNRNWAARNIGTVRNSWRSIRNRSSGSPIQITARKPSR